MTDFRAKWAVIALCAIALVAAGAGFFLKQHATPPIVISGAPAGDTAPDPAIAAPVGEGKTAKNPKGLVAPPEDPSFPDPPAATPSATPTSSGSQAPAPPAAAPLLYVDVAGAVMHPGLYQIPSGLRIAHAIHAAGGATERADLDSLNLAEKLQDGEKIYVPRKGEEVSAADVGTGESASYSNSLSAPVNLHRRHQFLPSGQVVYDVPPAPVLPGALPASPTAGDQSATTSASAHGGGKIAPGSGETIDINSAAEADLERLPGVGPGMAQRILAYRQQNGPFASIDDLRQVSGIGAKRFANLQQYVTAH